MDTQRIGRVIRALRHNRSWRQEDVGHVAGVSQDAVSRAERGRIEGMPLERLDAIVRALDAELVVAIRWRGGELDRLLDEGHAALVGRVTELLERVGWEGRPEVTFSIWGERGSIDLFAWHEATRAALVIEVKTELTSVEETLRRHDAKVRLAAGVARDQLGWQPRTVARLLVLPNNATSRRRVQRHDAVLRRAYIARGGNVRGWLRDPSGGMSGLMFVSVTHGTRGRRSPIARRRVRRSGSSTTPPSRGALAGPDGIQHVSGA